MPKQKPPTPDDPDRLVRQQAGSYRTSDERFEVRQTDQGWYLVDREQTDDFGQELVRGPFPTLGAVRAAIPPARSSKVLPLPRRPLKGTAAKPAKKKGARADAPEAPAPPPSWIDRLAPKEAANVRRMIRALEKEGLTDAEQLARRDREGLLPAVATAVIQRRLAALLDEATPQGRELAAQIVDLLTGQGGGQPEGLPGWMLVEIGPEPAPPNRRIGL